MDAPHHPLAYAFSHYLLVPAERTLRDGDRPVKVGGRAFDTLLALIERRDRVVGKLELLDLVWPNLVVEENNLQVQIVALRKLLGHPAIATVPGRGYRFALPVRREGGGDGALTTRPAGAAPGRAAPATGLPSRLPALVGREADLAALLELLTRHDLVVVAGPGGMGKTRLAQTAAAAIAATATGAVGGACWVDLASLAEASMIDPAVAHALGVAPGSAAPLDAIAEALRERQPLLVLDNAEHLLGGVVDFVMRLRAVAPRARLLLTSQEVLHVAGEKVVRPGPLTVADSDDPARIDASGAVRLFVERARAVDPRFALDADNRAAVADICRRLDGIPLAIELAAARLPLLGIVGLRRRLDDRFHVLTRGDRHSIRRHQTLRAALEWSHGLLSASEQAVLRRLGVFAGGFDLEAAQHVAADDLGLDHWDVLEHLGALVDKSLVGAEGDAVPRYRLLETTRLFALERLLDSDEADAVRGRHLAHFLGLAEQAIEQMRVGHPDGLAFFDRERDNLLRALAWPGGAAHGHDGLRLAAATRWYWPARGLLGRGIEAMKAALARSAPQPPSVARCLVLAAAAHMEHLAGQAEAARRDIDVALDESRRLDDARCLCLTVCAAGFIALQSGDSTRARDLTDEAVALARQIGDGHESGNALALAAAQRRQAGDPSAARDFLLEGLALRQRLDHPWSEAVGRLNMASMELDAGDADAARSHLQRAAALLPRIDSEQIAAYLIQATAQWCAGAGEPAAAVLLEAARSTHYRRIGIADEHDAADASRLAAATAMLDDTARQRLQADGRELGLAAAARYVSDVLGAAP